MSDNVQGDKVGDDKLMGDKVAGDKHVTFAAPDNSPVVATYFIREPKVLITAVKGNKSS